MEARRPAQSSGYPSISIDEVVHSNSRRPLSTSAGNTAYPSLASTDIYHEQKSSLPTPIENTHPRYSPAIQLHQPHPVVHPPPAILPSQNFALQPPCTSTLEKRKSINRKRRAERHDTHYIVESPQYQQYRLRQVGHENPLDQKWPEDLEMAFLDAQVDIPRMGRRKFSYKGKPHGRNELISEYLWISHIKSLAPGEKPDQTKRRTRKQVSSHIQVLKGYMRQHPAYEQLFETRNSSRNPFQDSFKDDPCLKSLAKGELPPWRRQYWYHESRREPSPASPLKDVNFAAPETFNLWISRPTSEPESKYDKGAGYSQDSVQNAWHRFTDFDSRPKPRESLETLRDWRTRFPRLGYVLTGGNLSCDVIHMDVSLILPDVSLPKLSSLCASFDIFIPGTDDDNVTWQSLTILDKQLKQRDDDSNSQIHNRLESFRGGRGEYGTYMRVPFPVTRWAHAIQSLMTMQQEYEEGIKAGLTRESLVSARDYIEQIGMYQEIYSRHSPDSEQERRAVILWTFHKARRGKASETTWRHLDSPPSRRTIMSPPTYGTQVTASINENLWAEAPNIPLEIPNLLDPFVQGLSTPPHSGALQSPFMSNYSAYNNHTSSAGGPHDGVPTQHSQAQAQAQVQAQAQAQQAASRHQPAPHQSHEQPRHLSFMSTGTADSDTTLVEPNPCAMDNFLNSGSFGEHPSISSSAACAAAAAWLAPPIESFVPDHGWGAYEPPVSSAGHGVQHGHGHGHSQHQAQHQHQHQHQHHAPSHHAWDGGELKHAGWSEGAGFGAHDA